MATHHFSEEDLRVVELFNDIVVTQQDDEEEILTNIQSMFALKEIQSMFALCQV